MALYAFDEGLPGDAADDVVSNVLEFFHAYDDPHKNDDPDAEIGSLYLRGVEHRNMMAGTHAAEAFGIGGHRRVRQALKRLEKNFESGDEVVDIVGVGRGAALAVSFANEISERHPGVKVRFVGLFDMVGQFGAPGQFINAGHNLRLPANAAKVFHAMARDEQRPEFPLTRLTSAGVEDPDRVSELWFPGVHSDVGGGNANKLNRVPLSWMYDNAVRQGLPISSTATTAVAIATEEDLAISAIKMDAGPARLVKAEDRLHPSALVVGPPGGPPFLKKMDPDFSVDVDLESGPSGAAAPEIVLYPPLPAAVSDADMKTVYRIPHMDLSAAEPLTVGTEFTVSIWVDAALARAGEQSTPIVASVPVTAEHIEVDAWIAGTRHFQFPGERGGHLVVDLTGNAAPATIEFRVKVVDVLPDDPDARLVVYFVHDWRPSGQVSRPVSLAGGEASTSLSDRAGAETISLLHTEIGAKPPDLTIEIIAPSPDQRHLQCRVISPHLPALARAMPADWVLPSETGVLVSALMQEFVKPDISSKKRLYSLQGAGRQLWEVAPDAVKDAFWALVDHGQPFSTIFIVSAEPYMPWELMIPHRERDGAREERTPLGVEFAVGRWLSRKHESPRQEIPLTQSIVVAPNYTGRNPKPLKHSKDEAAYVISKIPGTELRPADLDNLDAVLAGHFGVLHVICHGADAGEMGKQTIYLEDGEFSTQQASGMDGLRLGLLDEPLVFLNACEVGRPTTALVGVGGFAKVFIDAGASAVIAPLWSIKDVIAPEVARQFYDAVCANPTVPFAQVMKGIRAQAYAAGGGEDTYASYCFYGDPSAARQLVKTDQ